MAVLPDAAAQPSTLRPDAAYLITGGLGALGLQAAEQLVAEGARHLLLAGRRGVTTADQQQALARLAAAGAEVRVRQVDMADAGAVQALLDQCEETAPLRGIVHAAGLLDDGVTAAQSRERFASVMAPKAGGAWHLHRLTQQRELDFFLCFSSAASLLGSPGQSSYAAANGFLDGLMQERRRLGLPALSINWGPWAEVGLAAHLGSQMRQRGMGMISPRQGSLLFRRLLYAQHRAPAQVGVLPLLPRPAAANASSTTAQRVQRFDQRRYAALPAEGRREWVASLLQEMLCELGGFTADQIDIRQPFFSLGLDSLLAVRWRNQINQMFHLELTLPSFFESGNLETLAQSVTHALDAACQALGDGDKGQQHAADGSTDSSAESRNGNAVTALQPSLPGAKSVQADLAYEKITGDL